MFRKTRFRILFILTTLAVVSLACELPFSFDDVGNRPRPTVKPDDVNNETVDENLSDPANEDVSEPVEEIASDTQEQWTIDQCNAVQDVRITVENLEETIVDEGHVECNYTHKIINSGDQPIWIIYYKHFYYGDTAPPNDYEFGWNKVMPRQPGESWDLSSFLSDCRNCTPTRYESIHFSIAVVYDNPQCRWITEGDAPHRDVLFIAEEEPLLSPCTMLSPVSYSEAVPDISEGLRD